MKPTIIELRGHHLCADLLGQDPCVLDLGGHKGEFVKEVKDRCPGLRALVVEANPVLFEAMHVPQGVEKVFAAACGADGTATFYTSPTNPEGGNIFGETGQAYTLDTLSLQTLVSRLGCERIHLAKIDIEGAELDLLEHASDALLQRFSQFTIEFHDFIHSDHVPRIESLFQRLQKLGFLVIKCSMKFHRDVLIVSLKELETRGVSQDTITRICRNKALKRAIVHNLKRKLGMKID